MNLITINHDAFARYETVRRLLEKEEACTCSWCGNRAKFEYGIHNDGVYTKPEMDGIAFCSISCRRIYYS